MFDSIIKFMRATVQESGRQARYLKNAPGVACRRGKTRFGGKGIGHASDGYRGLALAWLEADREHGVTFQGLVML